MGLIIHDTEGSLDGTMSSRLDFFQNPNSGVSAHYVIGQDGRIIQMVADSDVAYHAKGTLQMLPAWMIALPKPPIISRSNFYTIGVELVLLASDPDGAYTDIQYERLRWLVDRLCQKWTIPRNRRRILGHGEVQSDRTDPRGLEWARIGL